MVRRFAFVFAIALLFLVGAFWRTYRLEQTVMFEIDQGMDAVFARAIVHDGHRPLVGPFLSVPRFYSPPTYYYILAAFLAVGGSIERATWGFVVLNLIAMAAVGYAAYRLAGRSTCLFALGLFAVSVTMVGYSRAAWQPHPTIPMLSIALVAAIEAERTRRVAWSVTSLFLVALAASVYPLALLLLPFFLWRQFVFFIRQEGSIAYAAASTIAVAAVSFFVTFLPQLKFEVAHGFPTFGAVFGSGFFSASRPPAVVAATIPSTFRLIGSVLLATPQDGGRPISPSASMFAAAFIVLMVWTFAVLRRKGDVEREILLRAYAFLSPVLVFSGIVVFIYYQEPNYAYRLGVFVPFAIMLMAMFARTALSYGSVFYRGAVALFIAFYTVLNVSTTMPFVRGEWYRSLPVKNAVVDRVLKELAARGRSVGDMTVIAIQPSAIPYNYHVFPYLYLFRERAGLSVPIKEEGNDVYWREDYHPTKPVVTVICEFFQTAALAEQQCARHFNAVNPAYEQVARFVTNGNIFVYLFERNHTGQLF